MFALAQQREVFALAMYIHQQAADLAQERGGHGPAVDPRDRTAVGAHFACQHQHVGGVAFQAVFDQQRGQPAGCGRAEVKRAFHLGALGAGAQHIGRGAVAQQQVDGINDDGFARAGLAGEHIEARGERQIEPINDGKVVDAEFCEHRSRS